MTRPKRITRADINLGTVRWEESYALVGLLGHWIQPGVCELHRSATAPWPDEVYIDRDDLALIVDLPVVLRSAGTEFCTVRAPAWAIPWIAEFPARGPTVTPEVLAALQHLGLDGRRALGDVHRVSAAGYWSAFTAATGIAARSVHSPSP